MPTIKNAEIWFWFFFLKKINVDNIGNNPNVLPLIKNAETNQNLIIFFNIKVIKY